MSTLLKLEDADLDEYTDAGVRGSELAPVSLPYTMLEAEATHVVFGLAAMKDDHLLDETRLVLAVRLRVDDVVHLWSDESGALAATVVLDPATRRMEMNLRFAPAGRSAVAAVADAMFLQAAGAATHLALRLPDGQFAPDRLPVPSQLKVDEGLVRLLQLIADVAHLANVDVPVPEEVDEKLITDLISARRLLSGKAVRGHWSTGEVRLDTSGLAAFQQALKEGSRHELLHVSATTLNVHGTVIALGEIRQQFSDAVVDDLTVEGNTVVVRLRAHDGHAPTVMTPAAVAPMPFEPHLVLAPSAFDELMADLDTPVRASRLREML